MTTPTSPVFTLPGAPPLAQPSFFTGPQDNLATADAYTASGGVINSISAELASVGLTIPNVLMGGKALASILPLVTGLINGNLSVNPAALAARLLASSGTITSAFKQLDPSAAASLTMGMSAIASAAVTCGGLTSQIRTSNLTNLYQVGGVISGFTNGASSIGIVDTEAVASIVGGIVQQATGYGIPNSYAAVTAGITDAAILARSASLALPSVISSSDALSLGAMASSLSPGAVTLLNPSALNQFSTSYTRTGISGPSASSTNDAATLAQITGAYNTVNPNWNACTRGSTTSTDITALMGASADLLSVINNGVMTLPANNPQAMYSLATLYPPTTVQSAAGLTFPQTVFTTGLNTQNNLDPTTIAVNQALTQAMPSVSYVNGSPVAS